MVKVVGIAEQERGYGKDITFQVLLEGIKDNSQLELIRNWFLRYCEEHHIKEVSVNYDLKQAPPMSLQIPPFDAEIFRREMGGLSVGNTDIDPRIALRIAEAAQGYGVKELRQVFSWMVPDMEQGEGDVKNYLLATLGREYRESLKDYNNQMELISKGVKDYCQSQRVKVNEMHIVPGEEGKISISIPTPYTEKFERIMSKIDPNNPEKVEENALHKFRDLIGRSGLFRKAQEYRKEEALQQTPHDDTPRPFSTPKSGNDGPSRNTRGGRY